MRAAVAHSGGISVEEVDEPSPGPAQVLLASRAGGICGSDLHMLDGLAAMGTAAPAMVLGHEFCAEVLDYGPGGARRYPVGTLVCAVPYATGPDGPELVGYSARFPGAFGERMVIDAERLVRVPDGIAVDHAALTEPLAVGLHAVNTARLQPGDPSMVLGCGPIGLAVLCALKAKGHGPVIAVDFSPARRASPSGSEPTSSSTRRRHRRTPTGSSLASGPCRPRRCSTTLSTTCRGWQPSSSAWAPPAFCSS